MKETRVAILGYGGIARSHKSGYVKLAEEGEAVKLVALCDIDENQFHKTVTINLGESAPEDLSAYNLYTDFDEMLAKEDIDTVDICLPTFLHKEYAIRALKAGKNVQCEKPMALTSADCAEMIAAAKESGKKLMIGQCLRFDSVYLALKEFLESDKAGKVLSIRCERYSNMPRWAFEGWFHDYSRSGGEMHDMSIHDYDMIRFLFGEPKQVFATSVAHDMPDQVSHAVLQYENGMIASVGGSWAEAPSFGFRAGFHVTTEKATVIWSTATGAPKVYPAEGEAYELTCPARSHMAAQSLYFHRVVTGEIENTTNPPESAMQTVVLVEKLKESAAKGGIVIKL